MSAAASLLARGEPGSVQPETAPLPPTSPRQPRKGSEIIQGHHVDRKQNLRGLAPLTDRLGF